MLFHSSIIHAYVMQHFAIIDLSQNWNVIYHNGIPTRFHVYRLEVFHRYVTSIFVQLSNTEE